MRLKVTVFRRLVLYHPHLMQPRSLMQTSDAIDAYNADNELDLAIAAGLTTEEFDEFVSIDDTVECHGIPMDEKICSVLQPPWSMTPRRVAIATVMMKRYHQRLLLFG